MKATLLFSILFVSFNTNAQSVSFKDYFPLKNGKINIYNISQVSENKVEPSSDDSSICKSYTIKEKEIFYFDDHLISDDYTIIGSQSFPFGVFYYDSGNFMFSPIFWKYELKEANLNYFKILFPKDIQIDSAYYSQDGDEKRTYRFTGFETIERENVSFNNCLKLTVTQDWPTAQYIDTVWFLKDVGIVKWQRGTGRLEEIKYASIKVE